MKNKSSTEEREALLARHGFNSSLLPSELVDLDLLSDSLMHRPVLYPQRDSSSTMELRSELESAIGELFGFPHVILVSQGRLAEAVLFKILVENGTVVPAGGLFPTTRAHIEANGGSVIEIPDRAALDLDSEHLYRSDLDLKALEKSLAGINPRWVPFVALEPCCNAFGGGPLSLINLSHVKQIAESRGVPVYLDACRVVENTVLLSELGDSAGSVWNLVRETCAAADFCTFSASKDLPVSLGGFIGLRSEEIYHQCLDIIAALGSGLSLDAMLSMLNFVERPEEIEGLVRQKTRLTSRLYEALSGTIPVVSPVGGHAVFLDAASLFEGLPAAKHPGKSFLVHLFRYYGVRGGEHPLTPSQAALGEQLLRFAVPLLGVDEEDIDYAAAAILSAASELSEIEGLVEQHRPPGLTGAMRAQYRIA